MSTTAYETLHFTVAGHVATLTLNRPDSRNALNLQMCRDIVAACEQAGSDPDIRVLLIKAAGKAFCAGADLKERQGMSTADMLARRVEGFTAYDAIEALAIPVIAVVHGPAFGSGGEIAAACDFVLASTEAAFKYPEVGWGTVGATQRLPRIVGRRMAKELLYTGRVVDAAEALSLGLANHVYAADQLDTQAEAMAAAIAKNNPLTVRLTKHSIDSGLETTRKGAMAVELLAIQENLRHSDWKGAIAKFGNSKEPLQNMAGAPGVPAASQTPVLDPVTAAAALLHTASQFGAQEAYVGPGERLSWKDIAAGARRTAAALHAAGIRHGDHVGVLMGNSGAWIQTFLGIASIGAVTVPVNTRFKMEELRFCLKQADVRLLVFADEFLGIDFRELLQAAEPAVSAQLPGTELPQLLHAVMMGEGALPAGCLSHADFIAAGSNVSDETLAKLAAAVSKDDVLLIQYTSGTTSFPKGVMLSHANMLLDAQAAAKRMGVRADDRYFSIRPFFHVAGSTLSVLVSVSTGCCLLSLPRFDVAENLAILDRERCSLISGNDTIFLMLMGHSAFDAGKLHLRGGWAAAGPEVMEQIHSRMRVPGLCNAYGQSEAAPNVLLSSFDDPLPLRINGFGFPHPGTEVRLADPETDQPRAAGEHGEIQVRGWNVMRGYYKMPEATAKAFSQDGWLKTGDLGEMNAEGRVRMVSRLKDMYRVGGENVAPSEVEEVLHAHPAVRQAQVIGVPDARLGEVTGAFVLLKEGQDASPEALINWCKERSANFKVPRYLEIVSTFDNIGMTGSSKVQKNKLREHALKLWKLAPAKAAA